VAGLWFPLGTPVSSIKKADRNNITEILFKMALNTIKHANKQTSTRIFQSKMIAQTLSHNVVFSTPRHEQDSNSQC
jgi:hypothetical protein